MNDNGAGLQPKLSVKLRKPFVTTNARKTLLGLIITQRLVERMVEHSKFHRYSHNLLS